MAKISARGAREIARWRKDKTGAEVVLTSDGRLLVKWAKGETWRLAGRNCDLVKATNYVAARTTDFVRV